MRKITYQSFQSITDELFGSNAFMHDRPAIPMGDLNHKTKENTG